MMFNKPLLSVSLALATSVFAAPSRADWVEAADLYVVRPAPVNRQSQAQNPPAFAWARYPGAIKPAYYMLEVSKDGSIIANYTSTRNFYLPSKALATGQYSWRVRPNTKVDWSTPRSFTIDSSAQLFEVPENDAIKARLLAHARPRQQAPDFLPKASWSSAMLAARGPAVTRLSVQVNNQMAGQLASLTAPTDTQWPLTSTTPTASRTAYIAQITRSIGNTTNQALGAALLYRITGESKYLQEALTRGDQLAALDPNGMTSYVNHDIATRSIMLALAKVSDLIAPQLSKDVERKARWMAAISARVAPMYADLIRDNYRLDDEPYDSHGTVAMGYLAVISALTMGDIPAATTWFDFSFRSYVNSIYVWSGPEGGYSNGTSYAMFSTDYALQ